MCKVLVPEEEVNYWMNKFAGDISLVDKDVVVNTQAGEEKMD
jgi:hypothetical protein